MSGVDRASPTALVSDDAKTVESVVAVKSAGSDAPAEAYDGDESECVPKISDMLPAGANNCNPYIPDANSEIISDSPLCTLCDCPATIESGTPNCVDAESTETSDAHVPSAGEVPTCVESLGIES